MYICGLNGLVLEKKFWDFLIWKCNVLNLKFVWEILKGLIVKLEGYRDVIVDGKSLDVNWSGGIGILGGVLDFLLECIIDICFIGIFFLFRIVK